MAEVTANPAFTANSARVGGAEWYNISNATSDNDIYAKTYSVTTTPSDYLKLYGFGFNIGTSANIQGITLKLKRLGDPSFNPTELRDDSIKLMKDGNAVGSNKADTGTAWTGTETEITYGGSSDLWGTTWTPTQINNNTGFGILISAVGTTSNAKFAWVDTATITITYTIPVAQTITGKGRVQKTVTQTSDGKGRITKSASQTQAGLSRVQKTVTQTQTGLAKVSIITSQTQTGIGRVQRTATQTTTGVASMLAVNTVLQQVTGTSRIHKTVPQTQNGVARVTKGTTQTVAGISRVTRTVSSDITGVSKIRVVVAQTILGKANIFNTTTQTITGVALISEYVPVKITTKTFSIIESDGATSSNVTTGKLFSTLYIDR